MTERTILKTPAADAAVENSKQGMSAQTATRVEFALIGLSIVALFLIFQPFSLALFSVGCGVVVVSGLANNLLPLCEPGVPIRAEGFVEGLPAQAGIARQVGHAVRPGDDAEGVHSIQPAASVKVSEWD